MSRHPAERMIESIVNMTSDPRVRRQAEDALTAMEEYDEYEERVERLHDALRENGNGDFLTVLADRFNPEDLPLPADHHIESAAAMEEVLAERNRLFWSSFLAEESGEVSSCLNDGEPPEDFREEVADVAILCYAIADVFDFDLGTAFHSKMDENDEKPKRPEGTGKLPAEARGNWRGEQ